MKTAAYLALAAAALAMGGCTCATDSGVGGFSVNVGRAPVLNAPAGVVATGSSVVATAAPVCQPADEVVYSVRRSAKRVLVEK
jgi:hypothetical protein